MVTVNIRSPMTTTRGFLGFIHPMLQLGGCSGDPAQLVEVAVGEPASVNDLELATFGDCVRAEGFAYRVALPWSLANRDAADGTLVTKVGWTCSPQAAAVVNWSGLNIASATLLGWFTQSTGRAASTPPKPSRGLAVGVGALDFGECGRELEGRRVAIPNRADVLQVDGAVLGG